MKLKVFIIGHCCRYTVKKRKVLLNCPLIPNKVVIYSTLIGVAIYKCLRDSSNRLLQWLSSNYSWLLTKPSLNSCVFVGSLAEFVTQVSNVVDSFAFPILVLAA